MPEGLARLDRTTTQDGYRCSSADAFDTCTSTRKSGIGDACYSEQIDIGWQIKPITGVCIDVGSSDYIINANSGVVVCAGAIKTPTTAHAFRNWQS